MNETPPNGDARIDRESATDAQGAERPSPIGAPAPGERAPARSDLREAP
ncbi:hypothetical protein [Thiocystis violacea]|nr:hypothetical protein [Thiocystis violacea]